VPEKRDWPAMAEWFDEQQGDAGDLWHRSIIHPGILKVIGNVTGLRILDVGCGNGSLARHLAKMGNRVTGIDASAPIIDKAKAREAQNPLGVTYRVADAANLEMFEHGAFDLVVSNMSLMDTEHADRAITEMARVVEPDGRCVFCLCHPCFDVPGASTWLLEGIGKQLTPSRRISRYNEVFSEWAPFSSDRTFDMLAYHGPLSWYVRAIREAGLAVTAFEEPQPTEEFYRERPMQAEWIALIPMHCVIEARLFEAASKARPREA
jgi:SAM-dependent methyltransferase